jgi:hypothetical protein
MREITGKTHYNHRDFSAPAPKRPDQMSRPGPRGHMDIPIGHHNQDAITKPSGSRASKG